MSTNAHREKYQQTDNSQTHRRERGQSLVEVALTLPVLVLILAGALDLARAYYVFIALEDAAGQAALYLAVNPDCPTAADGSECADPNNAFFRAQNAGGGDLQWENVTVTSAYRPTPYGVGMEAEVVLEYNFRLLTPVIPQIFGVSEFTLTSHATQMLIAE